MNVVGVTVASRRFHRQAARLGGFVRILIENEDEEVELRRRKFVSRSGERNGLIAALS